MRETAWAPARHAEGLLIDGRGLTARALTGRGHVLISGNLKAAVAALATGAPILGLYAAAPDGAHALRIARDRALLVTPAPLGMGEALRDGWGLTSVDDGWVAVDVEGEDAASALAQGTSADLAGEFSVGRRAFRRIALPPSSDGRGLPAACRGAVARGAADLAGWDLSRGPHAGCPKIPCSQGLLRKKLVGIAFRRRRLILYLRRFPWRPASLRERAGNFCPGAENFRSVASIAG